MPRRKSSKQVAQTVISEKYRVPEYFKAAPQWLRTSRVLWITGSILGILWVALAWIGDDSRKREWGLPTEAIFMNGELRPEHRPFESACHRCHLEKSLLAVVEDRQCLECHSNAIQSSTQRGGALHHEWEGGVTPRCGECHTEHDESLEVTAVSDRFCVSCHGDLPKESGSFAVSFSHRLDEHPQFAVWRSSGVDPTRLKFPHALHLKEGGIPSESTVPGGTRELVTLGCSDCHVPERDGGNMAPIHYEKHCGWCHAHRILPLPDGQVPHESPKRVREYLLAYYYSHPDEVKSATPHEFWKLSREERFESAVRATVKDAELAVFHIGQSKCAQCHFLERGESAEVAGFDPLPVIEPPAIPGDWFGSVPFSHESHLATPGGGVDKNCLGCHAGATKAQEAGVLLIPKQESCVECHNPREVQNNCAFCHTFHRGGEIEPADGNSVTWLHHSSHPSLDPGGRLMGERPSLASMVGDKP